jgi:hypothetical protein
VNSNKLHLVGLAAGFLLIAAFVAVVLVRRGDLALAAAPKIPVAASSASAPAQVQQYSRASWLESVNATYRKLDEKADGEGITEFVACFDVAAGPKCSSATLSLFGKHDAFRRLTHFHGVFSQLFAQKWAIEPTVGLYVALADCDLPTVFISPVYVRRSGAEWLFMNRVAIMADGDIVIDRELGDVDRNSVPGRLIERSHIMLDRPEMEALDKIANARKLVVRLTGKRGFVTVDPKAAAWIQKDAGPILNGYRALLQASSRRQPASCR